MILMVVYILDRARIETIMGRYCSDVGLIGLRLGYVKLHKYLE